MTFQQYNKRINGDILLRFYGGNLQNYAKRVAEYTCGYIEFMLIL